MVALILTLACSEPPEPAPEARVESPRPDVVEVVDVPEPIAPAFTSSIRTLSSEEKAAMTGVSWRPGCPVPLEDLVRVSVRHHTFGDEVAEGVLIVHRDHGATVVEAFRAAFDEGFPIERMEPVVAFGASDQRSMEANNTSAFNCRAVTGGSRYSEHSYGHAIDINPLQNPYISSSGRTVLPQTGRDWLDRDDLRPGMLHARSALVESFVDAGWGWGGTWTRTRDYQHVSANGR